MEITVVWYKRDLRIADHAPLHHAVAQGPTLPIYVIEPEYWQQPDNSQRHWQFLKATLLELDTQLTKLGQPLWVIEDSIENTLSTIWDSFGKFKLFSYQEYGPQWVLERNQRVAKWCANHEVNWLQFQPFPVFQELANRDDWDGKWADYCSQALLKAPVKLENIATTPLRPEIWPDAKGWESPETEEPPAAGRHAGLEFLASFLKGRGLHYKAEYQNLTSMLQVCSRLSPYLATGAISYREVAHQAQRAMKFYKDKGHAGWTESLKVFGEQLKLQSHYMQQFSDSPEIEMEPLHRSFVGLRENEFDDSRFLGWSEGRTGVPIVDACMRCLIRHGWLSETGRALLISFACHQLWLHWRQPALHLARLSFDYDAAVHFPQVQLYADTMGIRMWQIHDIVALSKRLDPEGKFIRRFCPELDELSETHIHSPWSMSHGEQVISSCLLGEDYPEPIVDLSKAVQAAKDKIKAHLDLTYDPNETERIVNKHASRLVRQDFQDRTQVRGQITPESHFPPV